MLRVIMMMNSQPMLKRKAGSTLPQVAPMTKQIRAQEKIEVSLNISNLLVFSFLKGRTQPTYMREAKLVYKIAMH